MKNRFKKIMMAMMAISTLTACVENVPSGYVARRWERQGFDGGILGPGAHSCWGFCHLELMETQDNNFELPMQVLCKDSLNFNFSVSVLVSVDLSNEELVKKAFEMIPGDETTVSQLFATYTMPLIQQEAQRIVSQYTTQEIVDNRSKIIQEIQDGVKKSVDGSILVAKQVSVSNLSFPKVITDAQEARAQARVAIETAKAQSEQKAQIAQSDLELAKLKAQREIIEAQSVADANKIIAQSISPQYLAYKQIEAMLEAGKGDNNVFFVPYQDNASKQSQWVSSEKLLDAQLMKKIQDATPSVK